MDKVSNKAICKGVSSNAGYYYKITFPTGDDGTTYSFKLPNDFGLGGMSILDGKVMKTETKDMWHGGNAGHLNFKATINAGMHTLEVYGAEKCCDGTTRW
jgi:hypothetical protein